MHRCTFRAIKQGRLHSEYYYSCATKMGLITALFLCLVLLQDSKGPSVSAEYDQSCHISPQLEEECSVYAHQVTKPMLRYFEQVSQKIDKHSEEIESKNEQIKQLQEKETSLQRELDGRNEQIRQQGENIMKVQLENMNYKLRETAIFNDLREKIEQLPKNLCEYQNKELKELKTKEVELQRELESKNEQIWQLGEKMIKLQIENMNYKSKGDSMAALQEELRKQKVIIEQLPKTICEKEITEIGQIKRKLSSIEEKLIKNERELTSEKETTFGKYQQINQLGTQVKETVDRHEKSAASCLHRHSSGVQTVTLSRGSPRNFQVLCNSEWTVIQQRIRGRVDFYRDWNTYRNGFGDFWDGDFFLGLEKIHRLTAEQPHELYIHMVRFDGRTYFAQYDEFAISGEHDQYRLSKLGRFTGTPTDKLRKHENMRFTTYDRDNDKDDHGISGNCAAQRHGGWWYNNCADSNLNGKYYQTETREFNGIYWDGFLTLKQVKMMIRPKATLK